MATKLHLRCIACGSLRSFSTFFGDHDFEDDFDFDVGGVPQHELALGVNEIGGREVGSKRGRCRWRFDAVPEEMARALHDRYILALKQIEDDVNAARSEAGLPLLTWNRENPQ